MCFSTKYANLFKEIQIEYGMVMNMKLGQLLENMKYDLLIGNADCVVTSIVNDSRKLEKGCLFICIEGMNSDGHLYIEEAIQKKAAVIVVRKEIDQSILEQYGELPTIIKVGDTRYAMAFIAAAFYNHPAKKLKIIGVTGTKGKTTTTYLIKSILEKAGKKVGLIGTIETIIGDTVIPASHTTPESTIIQEYFSKMVEQQIEIVVMEVSSQGLMLHRTQGFLFDYGIFTNLEPDHIGPGEHKDLEDYIACKSLLFRQCKVGIINCDDQHYKKIIENHTCELEFFGFSQDATIQATDVHYMKGEGWLGVSFATKNALELDVTLQSPGKFSVYNALTAIALCRHFDIPNQTILEALRTAHVRGRIELVPVSSEFTVLIDYAHNAMALESLLTTLKEYEPKRLVCVFGCGGSRSKLRRFDMGRVSGRLADLTIITSDNPRDEEPLDIIADIKTGLLETGGEFVEICDRREAVAYAIAHAKPKDVIIIAGKGHEDYQEIKGVKYPMDDRLIIADVVRGM